MHSKEQNVFFMNTKIKYYIYYAYQDKHYSINDDDK